MNTIYHTASHGDLDGDYVFDSEVNEWINIQKLTSEDAQNLLECFQGYQKACDAIESYLHENFMYDKDSDSWVDWRALADDLCDSAKYK
jgi:ABC-type taurine transport system substrate-binding protein